MMENNTHPPRNWKTARRLTVGAVLIIIPAVCLSPILRPIVDPASQSQARYKVREASPGLGSLVMVPSSASHMLVSVAGMSDVTGDAPHYFRPSDSDFAVAVVSGASTTPISANSIPSMISRAVDGCIDGCGVADAGAGDYGSSMGGSVPTLGSGGSSPSGGSTPAVTASSSPQSQSAESSTPASTAIAEPPILLADAGSAPPRLANAGTPASTPSGGTNPPAANGNDPKDNGTTSPPTYSSPTGNEPRVSTGPTPPAGGQSGGTPGKPGDSDVSPPSGGGGYTPPTTGGGTVPPGGGSWTPPTWTTPPTTGGHTPGGGGWTPPSGGSDPGNPPVIWTPPAGPGSGPVVDVPVVWTPPGGGPIQPPTTPKTTTVVPNVTILLVPEPAPLLLLAAALGALVLVTRLARRR